MRKTVGVEAIRKMGLKDKFGLSWQVVPENVAEIVQNPKKMAAMMKLKKFDLAALEQAALS